MWDWWSHWPRCNGISGLHVLHIILFLAQYLIHVVIAPKPFFMSERSHRVKFVLKPLKWLILFWLPNKITLAPLGIVAESTHHRSYAHSFETRRIVQIDGCNDEGCFSLLSEIYASCNYSEFSICKLFMNGLQNGSGGRGGGVGW